MRATSTVVVFSSLLVAASVAAGPNDKPDPKKNSPATAGSAAAKASAGAGSSSGSGSAASSGSGSAASSGTDGAAAPDGAGAATPGASSPDLSTVKPEDMPTAVRMRRLEQKTQALKERAWQLKARVQMLKEQMLGGGAGAQAVVAHVGDMGASFRLIKLIYTLDGTQVFARTDDTAENLYKATSFDVFAGPISPGNHNLSAVATYRGHGYGVFEYLSKYTFTARGNQAFIASEGKISKVDCRGFEKGGPTTPLEKRPAIECKVTQVQPEKPADKAGDKAADKPADKAGAKPSASAPSTAPAPKPAPAGTPPASAAPAPSGTTPSGPSGK